MEGFVEFVIKYSLTLEDAGESCLGDRDRAPVGVDLGDLGGVPLAPMSWWKLPALALLGVDVDDLAGGEYWGVGGLFWTTTVDAVGGTAWLSEDSFPTSESVGSAAEGASDVSAWTKAKYWNNEWLKAKRRMKANGFIVGVLQ